MAGRGTGLTKLDEGVGPHGAVDALGVVGDDELLLQLVQVAEGQHTGVVLCAHHQIAHAQRAGEAGGESTQQGHALKRV